MDTVEKSSGWSGFVKAFKGDIIPPSHAEYDEGRRIWNGDIDKHPLVVVRCVDVSDVVAAVRFAREADILLAVRAGGHSYPGHSTCDAGILVDLSRMRALEVDPQKRTVTAQGGVLLGGVDKSTAPHGMVMPAGIVSHTGLAGLGLGGGFGYVSRKFGMTCDQFQRLQVVTANGEVVHASASENPDLFWGLRGGGGNFGIVTEFECRIHPLGPVQAGWLYFPMKRAIDVIGGARRIAVDGPRELAVYFLLGIPAHAAMVPVRATAGQRLLGVRVVYAGTPEAAQGALADLRSLAEPVADEIGPRDYVEVQQEFDAFAAHGIGWYMKGGQARELSDEFIETYVDASWKHHSELCVHALVTLGGAINDVAEMDSAYGSRSAQWHVGLEVGFTNPEEREHIVGWTKQTYETIRPLLDLQTSYVNMLVDEDIDRLESVYGHQKYERLRQVKAMYDSDNFFRCNSNIPPARLEGARG